MGGLEDVWYATNGEIYDYVAAFKSLIFSADGNTIHNPTATDVYLNYYKRHVKVEAGKTVILK